MKNYAMSGKITYVIHTNFKALSNDSANHLDNEWNKKIIASCFTIPFKCMFE